MGMTGENVSTVRPGRESSRKSGRVDMAAAMGGIVRTCDDAEALMDQHNRLAGFMGWKMIGIEEACERVERIRKAMRVIGGECRPGGNHPPGSNGD